MHRVWRRKVQLQRGLDLRRVRPRHFLARREREVHRLPERHIRRSESVHVLRDLPEWYLLQDRRRYLQQLPRGQSLSCGL